MHDAGNTPAFVLSYPSNRREEPQVKKRLIAILALAGALAASPGIAQAKVPTRKQALKGATQMLHQRNQMSSVFGLDATGEPVVRDGLGIYWRSLAPKIKRVKGGWNTCAVVVIGHRESDGAMLTRVGHVEIRGTRSTYAIALRLLPAGK